MLDALWPKLLKQSAPDQGACLNQPVHRACIGLARIRTTPPRRDAPQLGFEALDQGGCVAEIQPQALSLTAALVQAFVFDRPGYGYSERPRSTIWTPWSQADLLTNALVQIGVNRAIILGHSWGASVGIAAALRSPAAVRGLILESGYYYPSLRADVALFSGLAIPGIGDVLRYTLSPIAARLLWPVMRRKLFSPAGVAPSFARFPSSMAMRPSQLRASAEESALMVPDAMVLQRRYGELRMPVAIVAGTGDKMVDVDAQSRRLHGEIRQSSLHLVENCGHMVHHTAPRRVMAALEEVARAA